MQPIILKLILPIKMKKSKTLTIVFSIILPFMAAVFLDLRLKYNWSFDIDGFILTLLAYLGLPLIGLISGLFFPSEKSIVLILSRVANFFVILAAVRSFPVFEVVLFYICSVLVGRLFSYQKSNRRSR